jgi:DNA-binding CsgD family transcriptional regulator
VYDVVDDQHEVRAERGAEDLIGDTVVAIGAVTELARADDGPVPSGRVETLEGAADSLVAGEQFLRRRRAEAVRIGDAEAETRFLALLVRLQALRLSIGEAQVRRRAAATAALHRSLGRLRSGMAASELMREIPDELGRLGFSRSLVSALRGSSWTPCSAFAYRDASLAEALVEVGSAMPGRIGREEPETEMVRLRAPVLVRDCQNNPRIHKKLITLADTRDYAAAPVIVHGTVVGLLHVDRHSQTGACDADDRDLIGLFADGVGLAFERARYQERVSALKAQFERQIHGIDELMYGTPGWDSLDDLTGRAEPGRDVAQAYLAEGPLHELTRRELEVLQHLAGGASNQDVADRLGVSTGTVKTHVKSVLRKLGATNRADAAARFHQAVRR